MANNSLNTLSAKETWQPSVELASRPFLEGMHRFSYNKGALVGAFILLAMILIGILSPWMTLFSPIKMEVGPAAHPPNAVYLLGTDQFGRDIFSRLVHGVRLSMFMPFIAVLIAVVIGVPTGLISGYVGGWLDIMVMRIVDIMMAFPALLLALMVISVLGPGIGNSQIAIGISLIPMFVRMTRASALAIREELYIEAARVIGCKPLRIMLKHVLPHILSPLIVLITSAFTWSILTSAMLNFLGLGVPPPTPDWGADLSMARGYLQSGWWISTFPGGAIALVVLATNLLGEGLQSALGVRQQVR